MSFLMFITAIGTHVRNHHPDYNRVDMMQLTMAMFNAERDVNPAGGGFIGFIILVTHCATSYSFSRPKRRRERIWGRGGLLFFLAMIFKIESEPKTKHIHSQLFVYIVSISSLVPLASHGASHWPFGTL